MIDTPGGRRFWPILLLLLSAAACASEASTGVAESEAVTSIAAPGDTAAEQVDGPARLDGVYDITGVVIDAQSVVDDNPTPTRVWTIDVACDAGACEGTIVSEEAAGGTGETFPLVAVGNGYEVAELPPVTDCLDDVTREVRVDNGYDVESEWTLEPDDESVVDGVAQRLTARFSQTGNATDTAKQANCRDPLNLVIEYEGVRRP